VQIPHQKGYRSRCAACQVRTRTCVRVLAYASGRACRWCFCFFTHVCLSDIGRDTLEYLCSASPAHLRPGQMYFRPALVFQCMLEEVFHALPPCPCRAHSPDCADTASVLHQHTGPPLPPTASPLLAACRGRWPGILPRYDARSLARRVMCASPREKVASRQRGESCHAFTPTHTRTPRRELWHKSGSVHIRCQRQRGLGTVSRNPALAAVARQR
jgi:hypothetical protein